MPTSPHVYTGDASNSLYMCVKAQPEGTDFEGAKFPGKYGVKD